MGAGLPWPAWAAALPAAVLACTPTPAAPARTQVAEPTTAPSFVLPRAPPPVAPTAHDPVCALHVRIAPSPEPAELGRPHPGPEIELTNTAPHRPAVIVGAEWRPPGPERPLFERARRGRVVYLADGTIELHTGVLNEVSVESFVRAVVLPGAVYRFRLPFIAAAGPSELRIQYESTPPSTMDYLLGFAGAGNKVERYKPMHQRDLAAAAAARADVVRRRWADRPDERVTCVAVAVMEGRVPADTPLTAFMRERGLDVEYLPYVLGTGARLFVHNQGLDARLYEPDAAGTFVETAVGRIDPAVAAVWAAEPVPTAVVGGDYARVVSPFTPGREVLPPFTPPLSPMAGPALRAFVAATARLEPPEVRVCAPDVENGRTLVVAQADIDSYCRRR